MEGCPLTPRQVNLDAWDVLRIRMKKDWDWAREMICIGKEYDSPPEWLVRLADRLYLIPEE